ncbi:putative flavin-containing monooxygenase [Aspergillus flavus AF70]|nr:putative flavin-containing monooxygenase [Aspergillus flavus AF70]
MHTVAEGLKQFPEQPAPDGYMTGITSWASQRSEAINNVDPEILIIGGGQNGLAMAARCKVLGMENLIIERSDEVGDIWKKRYEYLSLYFPHWLDALLYFKYSQHWPMYIPAQKQALYMQWYASVLELNVWTKSSVVKAEQDAEGKWTIIINKEGKETRILYPNAHDSAREFVGKKICVVVPRMLGSYAPDEYGNLPDLEEQDRLFFSMLVGPGEELSRRTAKVLEDLDRPLLEALNARGLRTWRGQRDTGNSTLGQTRNGGFYFDAGACEEIINGNIKVEPGYIEKFTADKVILNSGREKEFDLVVFATGFSNMIDSIRATLGEKIASQCGSIWGIDEEGEYKTVYRETGVPNLWIMVGFLPMTRYASKLLALRLKALQEGISPPPYKV